MYFPISEITDAGRYANLKKAIRSVYSFFDGNALDVARFIFGAECDEVIYHDGWMMVDEEVDIFDIEEEDFDSDMSGGKSTGPILEGSCNNTMSRFAGRILKKYGDTEKAHEAFLEHARKCDPPLPDAELRSAQISTDLSAIERRVGLACAVAKLNRGDSRKKPPPKGSGTIVKHRILLLDYLKDL